jgi:hypothetical protein
MKVSINIASIPDRVELLKQTVKSLYNQCDVINICLNNYDFNPFENDKKINVLFSDNSLGDGGKFLFQEPNCYYFTCDDDLIYPPNYVEDTIPFIDKYKIVSYHGRIFSSFPLKSYYHTPCIRHRCLDDANYTEPVHIAGTGVMAFNTNDFIFPTKFIQEKNMADIWVSAWAKLQGFKIWHIAHKKGYFDYLNPDNTIWDEKHLKDEFETNIVNHYFK